MMQSKRESLQEIFLEIAILFLFKILHNYAKDTAKEYITF